MKPTIKIHNVETDEIIEREMTTAEIKQFNEDVSLGKILKTENEAKVIAREALLERLGITAEEAALLLG